MSLLRIGIVGAGKIAQCHLDVLAEQKSCQVIGITSRSQNKASDLAQRYKIPSVYKTIDDLVTKGRPDALLILVSADHMFDVTSSLLDHKIPLFVEKPPALSLAETEALADKTSSLNVSTMVGLNRRYYSIFKNALRALDVSHTIYGVSIEGHERYWTLADIPEKVQKNWIFANSIHHIDLLRFFGGEISHLECFASATRETSGDQFIASGVSSSGILLNYLSHWHSPGGWSVTLFCDHKTIKFSPLEQGFIYSTDGSSLPITPDNCDTVFKPGFYHQSVAFLRMATSGILELPGQSLIDVVATSQLVEQFKRAGSRGLG